MAQGTESVCGRCHPSLPLPLTLARDGPVANPQKGHRALSHWMRTHGVFAHGAHDQRMLVLHTAFLVAVVTLNAGLRGTEEPAPGHRAVPRRARWSPHSPVFTEQLLHAGAAGPRREGDVGSRGGGDRVSPRDMGAESSHPLPPTFRVLLVGSSLNDRDGCTREESAPNSCTRGHHRSMETAKAERPP